MKVTSLLLSALIIAGQAQAVGFGFDVGPFNLQMWGPDPGYVVEYRNILDEPICHAIANQQRIQLIVQGTEVVSEKEKKIVTKQLTVEPYAYGSTNNGRPVLQGNIVEDKMVEELTLKYDDPQFASPLAASTSGQFSGKFESGKQTIDISRVSDIRVVEGSHFDVPKDYKGLLDPTVSVICQLPVTP